MILAKHRFPSLALAATLIAAPHARAMQIDPEAESPSTEAPLDQPDGRGWHFSLTPYFWLPAIDGTVGIRGRSTSVDADIGDTFDAISNNFNFAAAIHAEVTHDRLALFGDVMYLSLETDTPADTLDIRQNQGIFELGLAYAVIQTPRSQGQPGLTLEPLAGARVQHISLEIDLDGAGSDSGSQTWADGFVGARARIDLTDRVALRLRGDIGAGDSDLTWSALAGLGIMLCPHATLELGYRALDTDYSDGHGTERFEYDLLLHGPYAALTISF